jgi:SAM-dependent methyltransferase
VKERYGAIARGEQQGCGCGCSQPEQVATAIGYTAEQLAAAGEANLGLGCGNPLALAALEPGMTVLDLGSGAGFDAFLAARAVGPEGRVIGVDMTTGMLERARRNAVKQGAANVEFRQAKIEALPVADASVDYVISNCVINLSADKPAVFREISRVLRPGGRFAVSDLVLLEELPQEIAQDLSAYVGCVAGASQLTHYVSYALAAGLRELSVPVITPGRDMVNAYSPAIAGQFSPEAAEVAARALVSIRLHGRKPR